MVSLIIKKQTFLIPQWSYVAEVYCTFVSSPFEDFGLRRKKKKMRILKLCIFFISRTIFGNWKDVELWWKNSFLSLFFFLPQDSGSKMKDVEDSCGVRKKSGKIHSPPSKKNFWACFWNARGGSPKMCVHFHHHPNSRPGRRRRGRWPLARRHLK